MKILLITPVVPTKSDGRRPYNFIKYLAKNHAIHLLCFRMPVQNDDDIRHLESMGVCVRYFLLSQVKSVLSCCLGLFARMPLRVSWCRSASMRREIQRVCRENQFDIVHIDRMRMGQYANVIPYPTILDFTDSLSLYLQRSFPYRTKVTERLIDFWESKTIPDYEESILEDVNESLLCSDVDKACFIQFHPNSNPTVIENAVNPEQFNVKTHEEPYEAKCVITGTLFYFPNIDSVEYYARDILPLLLTSYPDLKTQWIGKRPKEEVLLYDGKKGVEVIADVPAMQDYLFADDIYVCPLRVAAGVRNKLLEAMSAGMPIVTTRLGAEGLAVQDGTHVLFAETPEEFFLQIKRVKADTALRLHLGRNARAYIQENHALEKIGKKLDAAYQRVIQNHICSSI
jgi:glycosyltransferase involved in cell wall biosynthesis